MAINVRITNLEAQCNSIEAMISGVGPKWDKFDSRLISIETSQSNISIQIRQIQIKKDSLKVALDNLESGQVRLEVRLVKIETEIIELATDIDVVQVQVDELENQLMAVIGIKSSLKDMLFSYE